MALNPDDVGELNKLMRSQLEVWMHIKLAIQKAFGKTPITRDHENAFLKLKSDLSRLYRVVSEKVPKELQFEGDDMIDLMKGVTTMAYLNALPLTEKQNILNKWHRIYVLMSRTFGSLEVMSDGYYPRLHRALLKPDQGRGKGKKRGKKKKKR